MSKFKPMLAVKADLGKLAYPVYGSVKLDGIRVVITGGVVYSRNMKPIPNAYVQKLFGKKEYEWLDGELIIGDVTADDVFQVTSSGVMTQSGKPDVRLYVFDQYDYSNLPLCSKEHVPYSERLKKLMDNQSVISDDNVITIKQRLLHNIDELNEFESMAVADGFEGIMLRSPNGKYKNGRSTVREGYLLKVKRFEDDEAKLISMEEFMSNNNEQTIDELGHKVRSHKKDGMVPAGKMGALVVQNKKFGLFKIGSGFSDAQRKEFWFKYQNNRNDFIGQLVKFKYQPSGIKDKPRFPVFLGFRNKIDK